jgi:pyridoxamine 5'-phosphate oxidase
MTEPTDPETWPDRWLSEDPLPLDPLPIAAQWLSEAFADGRQPSPHAVALATVDAQGAPSVRMVLVQRIETASGAIVFFTNRTSRKGTELAALPRAATAFHFGPLNRQVRVSGPITETDTADSDDYFATRPVDAQIGAWASQQSQPLESRAALLAEMDRLAAEHDVDLESRGPDASIPRPPQWGGYRLHAESVELWHSRPGRIHDRAEWTRTLGPAGEDPGPWSVRRLQP